MPARLSRRHCSAEATRNVAKANGKARDARDDPRARIPGRPGPLTAIGAYARRKEARMLFVLLALALNNPSAGDAFVTGRVLDPSSQPVAGAKVLVVCGATIVSQSLTDGEGRFQTHPAHGRCRLRIAADGLTAPPVDLDLSGPEPRDAGTITLAISAITESVVVSAAQADV